LNEDNNSDDKKVENVEDLEKIKEEINAEIGRKGNIEEDEAVQGEEKTSLKEELLVDAFGFACFLTFVLIIFFLLFSYIEGTYPFTIVPTYNIIGYNLGYIPVLQDYLVFYILYWVTLGCLLLGLWRYNYEWWLILLMGILGTMLFFMFFV